MNTTKTTTKPALARVANHFRQKQDEAMLNKLLHQAMRDELDDAPELTIWANVLPVAVGVLLAGAGFAGAWIWAIVNRGY